MANIRKRGEYSYQITVFKGRDGTGTKLIETKTITLDPKLTPKQAEKELHKQATLFETEVKNGTYLDGGKITFSEFVSKWLNDYAEKQLQPKTIVRYKEMLYGRIIPAFGNKKLNEIQPHHLLEFYNNLAEKGVKKDGKFIAKPELSSFISKNKVTIYEFARVAKVDIRTLKYALNGRTVSQHTAELLCKVLNVKIKDIFLQSGGSGKLSDQTIKHHHRLISSILTFVLFNGKQF